MKSSKSLDRQYLLSEEEEAKKGLHYSMSKESLVLSKSSEVGYQNEKSDRKSGQTL